jgi:hypothetical protein
VDLEFFGVFDRAMVAGRAFHMGDRGAAARTAIVNEAFARKFSRETGGGSPLGARLRYAAAEPWLEIVGVVRDLGLDPDDSGHERPYVFHASSAGSLAQAVMNVRVRGNAGALAARLPFLAAGIDARLLVHEAKPLEQWIGERDQGFVVTVAAQAAVTGLVLFLSALSIFSLVSVSVSRRTREIGLRAALGANPRQVLGGVLARALVLMGGGAAAGGALLLVFVAQGGPGEDVVLYAGYFGVTSAIMLAAGVIACIGPARRALRISPADALREA